MKINERQYNKLLPYFEQSDVNCAQIAVKTGISGSKVVTYYSIYLNRKMYNSRYRQLIRMEEEKKQERCPTCGRLKHEVTDMAVCRDVFHYL